MEGVSFLTDGAGHRQAVVINFDVLKNRSSLLEILEDIEDEIAIELRKNEPRYDWREVKDALINND